MCLTGKHLRFTKILPPALLIVIILLTGSYGYTQDLSTDYSLRLLYDQGIDFEWTGGDDYDSNEKKSFGLGGAGLTVQGGVVFGILPDFIAYVTPEAEFFAELTALRTSQSFLYYTGAGAALRVLYTGIYIGYGYSHQKADFSVDGEDRKLKPQSAAMIGCFVDYPVMDKLGVYLGVHMYDRGLFKGRDVERWERLSIRGGVSWRP